MSIDIGIYLQLIGCAMISVLISTVFYILERYTPFKKLPYAARQIIIGIVFGGAAVFGTEFGVDIGGAVANARDAAPVCAGLLFGGPAGIIAGVIGGVERWFAVYWGGGTYSRVACSLSTILAGIYSAFLRKQIFDDKRPTPVFGFATGGIMEIIHMTVLFITHIQDTEQAFDIVKICTLPMVLCNGASVWLSILIITLFSSNRRNKEKKQRHISQQVQNPLLIAVVLAFFATSIFVFALQTNVAILDSQSLIKTNMEDIKQDILAEADENILLKANGVAGELDENADVDLKYLAEKYVLADIWVVDENGIITESTDGQAGFDMHSDENLPEEQRQCSNFLVLLTDECDEYVQEYGPLASDSSVFRKIAGVKLENGGFVQVGYDGDMFRNSIAGQIGILTANRHIGENGYMLVVDEQLNIVSENDEINGKPVSAFGVTIDEKTLSDEYYEAEVNGVVSMCMFEQTEGFTIIGILPRTEIFVERDNMTYINAYMEIIVFAALFIVIYVIIKRIVVVKLRSVNKSLAKIIGGDLDTVVDVRSSDEFSSLSDDINTTVCTLKNYINEAASRIDRELAFAKSIQYAVLPSVFPAYPDRNDFDVYATMKTAKEVGGDFYDFYLLGDNRFGFLIADVSGKGIPAAMFMMTAKTMLKNLAETGIEVDEIFTKANNKLCEGNEAEMFVTAWMGIIDLETGCVTFANAGHNPPLIRRKGGEYEYLKSPAGLVLAGMEGMNYKIQKIDLNPGDRIFLYTDGVTEAENSGEELYGEARLCSVLNGGGDVPIEKIPASIQSDIDSFVNGAEQFDDITMLVFEYKGKDKGIEKEFDADVSQLDEVIGFAENELEKVNCPAKTVMQVTLSLEEAFVNIANYAYEGKQGTARIMIDATDSSVKIVLTDSGKPFNPLEREMPDVTLAAEDRKIGGLGIFMIRKQMDDVSYEYKDGKNIFTMCKNFKTVDNL